MLEKRTIRYADLKPCFNAFVDSRTPGSDKKENFTLIGPGVSENPNQFIHIPEPHGFNIGAARQPPKCYNSQHSHETAEVFVIHSGKWRFLTGINADEGDIILTAGDTISLPIHMFRGFENIGDDTGFVFAVLGGDDPGKVTWSPKVFELAKHYGLVLLEGGKLIDTVAGEKVPAGAKVQAITSEAEIKRLATPTPEKMMEGVVYARNLHGNKASPLASEGVEECPIITPNATKDGFKSGPITGWWPHGFNLRALKMKTGASIKPHKRAEEEVIFIHKGSLEVTCNGEKILLAAGDTFTTPKGSTRSFRATSSDGVWAYVVRGGDEAGEVQFV